MQGCIMAATLPAEDCSHIHLMGSANAAPILRVSILRPCILVAHSVAPHSGILHARGRKAKHLRAGVHYGGHLACGRLLAHSLDGERQCGPHSPGLDFETLHAGGPFCGSSFWHPACSWPQSEASSGRGGGIMAATLPAEDCS